MNTINLLYKYYESSKLVASLNWIMFCFFFYSFIHILNMRINDTYRPSKSEKNLLLKVILLSGVVVILISFALSLILTIQTGKLNKIYGVNNSLLEVCS